MDSKTPIDLTAATSTGAVWMGMLPEMLTVIATGLTIIWFAIRIWETETVQKIRNKLKAD
jgi:hypothetical protein